MTADISLIGTMIGSYRIVDVLGEGGMGTVYRAHDTRLGRDVAIKVLSQTVSGDAATIERFDREARALASLNHPNIAAIYGVDESTATPALVLELVGGETLADRLRRGSMGIADTIAVAQQIAAALDAAHGSGIVHRDLKPANIKITAGGTVKVLDFGLAKLTEDGRRSGTGADLTRGVTGEGMVAGTPAYMSPEQARGKPVDKRTDVWSFGCVLYEMLAGRAPFGGESISDTIVAVLEREPDWRALPSATPPAVSGILRRALQKDPQQRMRDIGDVGLELRHTAGAVRSDRAGRRWSPTSIATTVVILMLVIAAATFGWRRRQSKSPAEAPEQLTDFSDSATSPSLSHDGRMLTFIRGGSFGASSRPGGQVYVKLLPAGQPVQLTRDGVSKDHPVFTPDDSRIVYTTEVAGMQWDSWQVPALGGSPQSFLANASGLQWLRGDRVVYSAIKSGIQMAIATSTESRSDYRELYVPQGPRGMAHRTAVSPDRRSLLVVEMDSPTWLPCRLIPADGSSAGRRVGPLDGGCTSAAWSSDGRWMYFSSNAGGAFHAIMPVVVPMRHRAFYLMLKDDTSGELWSGDLQTLDHQRVLPGLTISTFAISHDGTRVLFTTKGHQNGDGIWIADLEHRDPPRQLTRGGELRAFFGAPGEIIYASEGETRRLYRAKDDGSPDGRWATILVPRPGSGGGTNVELVSLRGEQPIALCNDACSIGPRTVRAAPSFNWSFDGQWFYVSLQHFGGGSRRTVALPYHSNIAAPVMWPNGLRFEKDIVATPGAQTINAPTAFPGRGPSEYLFSRTTVQSNLYRVQIPD